MNDFDFLIGNWQVTNRRLKERLVGSDDWEEFVARSEIRSLFDGAANIDEIIFPDGTRGLTLRLYQPATQTWTLNWVSSDSGTLFPPIEGHLVEGQGLFYGEDSQDGTAVKVRFIWSGISPTTARWEQAFSVDGGQAWETNWYMDFART